MWVVRIRPAIPSWSTARFALLRPRWHSRFLNTSGGPSSSNQQPANQRSNSENPTGPASNTAQSRLDSLSTTLRNATHQDNSLLAPVHIPEDPNAVLKERHPAAHLLANSGLVVQRQLEMMNVLVGFEQANRYVILDAQGNHVGYIVEEDPGIKKAMARQWFTTHRSFVTHVFDRNQNEILRFHRPFSWISSRIRVYDPLEVADTAESSFTGLQTVSERAVSTEVAGEMAKVSPLKLSEMRIVGEAQQQWAPLRQKYNLFLFHSNPDPETNMGAQTLPPSGADLSKSQQLQVTRDSGGQFSQFAYVDEPFLSWDYSLKSADSRLIGSVNRDFSGFAREIFTDTGVYALRMDAAALSEEKQRRHLVSQTHKEALGEKGAGMTLDQRAVMLATAVSIDFDHFSRHSGSHGFLPFPMFGGSSAEGAAGGAAGGAAEGAAGGAAGGAVEGTAAGEGVGAVTGEAAAERVGAGVAGAGSMAGYEAMRRGMSESPQEPDPGQQTQGMQGQEQQPQGGEEVWGEDIDFWGRGGGTGGAGGGSNHAPSGGGEGDGGWLDGWEDIF